MTARAPDAATAVNPWSTACGMKCWPTSPFDVAPQTKNVPARNQKSLVRTARPHDPRLRRRVVAIAPSATPSGRAPTSAGSLRNQDQDRDERASASTPARPPRAASRPRPRASSATGRRSAGRCSCWRPRMPVTRPRCRTNQRVATVGPRTLATRPVPRPDSSPKNEGQLPDLADQARRDERDPPVMSRLSRTTPRTPIRAISQPLSGPDRPNTTRPMAAANDTRRRRPARLLGHRQEERAGCRADAGRHEHDHGRDRDDDPAVEDRRRVIGSLRGVNDSDDARTP